MNEENNRTSKVQRQIMECLISGLKNDHLSVKSTVLNAAVSKMLEKEIHPNNFRTSCETLEERRLIMRTKDNNGEWVINITPRGVEFME